MTKHILNEEQLMAHREAARAANPNRQLIDDLRTQSRALSDQILSLMSEDERYCNLMMALSAGFDSRVAAVSLMSDGELTGHLYSLFVDHANTPIDEAILDEAIKRLGGLPEDEV